MDMNWSGNRIAEYEPASMALQPMNDEIMDKIDQEEGDKQDNSNEENLSDGSSTDKEELGPNRLNDK
jgi:hypothetical protein